MRRLSQFHCKLPLAGRSMVLLLVLMTTCCAGLIAITSATAPMLVRLRADLSSAEARWAARPFDHYRLVVTRDLTFGGPVPGYPCQQQFEVRAEQIQAIPQNTCPDRPLVVTELLHQLEQDSGSIQWPEGVGCEYAVVDVSFDQQLGYPSSIAYHLSPPDVADLGLWQYILAQGRGCRPGAYPAATIKIDSLMALP